MIDGEIRIGDDEFFVILDDDLFEKFLQHGEEYFDDPMMRRAYMQIQMVRNIMHKAEQARLHNEAIQAKYNVTHRLL